MAFVQYVGEHRQKREGERTTPKGDRKGCCISSPKADEKHSDTKRWHLGEEEQKIRMAAKRRMGADGIDSKDINYLKERSWKTGLAQRFA